jgi:pyruvate formate lyase activating enzyme
MEHPGQTALFWREETGGAVSCQLCPHRCRIARGESGRCRVRRNEGGRLVAASYGRLTALALDPIEKKPLNLFFPGSFILSAGSFGCNLRCRFCQNWEIAQQEAPSREVEPQELVRLADKARAQGNIGLAYTYNEPLVGYEFVLDCARLVRQAGMRNVLVSNGYINPEPLEALLPFIDAANIDLKAWNDRFYSQICGGRREPVLAAIRLLAARCHLEVTTLLLPGENDSEEEIGELAAFLAALHPDIPLHLSRHHPDYQMSEPPPISLARMEKLAGLARRSLRHVWLGNT